MSCLDFNVKTASRFFLANHSEPYRNLCLGTRWPTMFKNKKYQVVLVHDVPLNRRKWCLDHTLVLSFLYESKMGIEQKE